MQSKARIDVAMSKYELNRTQQTKRIRSLTRSQCIHVAHIHRSSGTFSVLCCWKALRPTENQETRFIHTVCITQPSVQLMDCVHGCLLINIIVCVSCIFHSWMWFIYPFIWDESLPVRLCSLARLSPISNALFYASFDVCILCCLMEFRLLFCIRIMDRYVLNKGDTLVQGWQSHFLCTKFLYEF